MFSLRCAFRAVQTAFTGRDVARVHTRIEQQCFRTKFSRGGTCYFVGALTSYPQRRRSTNQPPACFACAAGCMYGKMSGSATMRTLLFALTTFACLAGGGASAERMVDVPCVLDLNAEASVGAKATLVFMTHSFERHENVRRLLACYAQMQSVLQQIILVWNGVGAPPPVHVQRERRTGGALGRRAVPIAVWKAPTNELTNRYWAVTQLGSLAPGRNNSTEAVLMADDDVLLSESLVHAMLLAWSASDTCNQECIVGLDPRYADAETGAYSHVDWHASAQAAHRANIAITKSMLVHRNFIQRFMTDQRLVAQAAPLANVCEDISLSFYVLNASGRLPCFPGTVSGMYRRRPDTSSPQRFLRGVRHDLPQTGGLSINSSRTVWMHRRSVCARWCLEYFGEGLRRVLSANVSARAQGAAAGRESYY